MDSTNNLMPLFEAKLILEVPKIKFVPSLKSDGPNSFKELVVTLIDDVINTVSRANKFSSTAPSHVEEIYSNEDIVEIKNNILANVDKMRHEAIEFSNNFDNFSYLWLDNRNEYLKQFLTYGRQLSDAEIELVILRDPHAPSPCDPKMDTFREEIEKFENLYCQVDLVDSFEIFDGWFKVDATPFKETLLNIIKTWGDMFKDYLVDKITSGLSDLGSFIREADEGLQQTVVEGDYQALVEVMGYLFEVKERQVMTDEMFGPLREIVELLTFCDQDIPEEVNVWLQELPEQWNNTKKIAITVKQQVAPLQAAEITFIRKKINDFDSKIGYYREVFRRYSFFTYNCTNTYNIIDMVDKDLDRLENEMSDIQQSGSLFEVSVPDFKLLKQCRKELRMLKVSARVKEISNSKQHHFSNCGITFTWFKLA